MEMPLSTSNYSIENTVSKVLLCYVELFFYQSMSLFWEGSSKWHMEITNDTVKRK
jgi:hypothetical protein